MVNGIPTLQDMIQLFESTRQSLLNIIDGKIYAECGGMFSGIDRIIDEFRDKINNVYFEVPKSLDEEECREWLENNPGITINGKPIIVPDEAWWTEEEARAAWNSIPIPGHAASNKV